MEDNVPSGGGVLYIAGIGEMILVESAAPVEINPDALDVVVENTETFAWILTGVGCTDLDYTTFYLKIGDDEGTHTNEPLGLFNDPMKISPGIVIGANIAVQYYASVSVDAQASQSYVGKLIGYKK